MHRCRYVTSYTKRVETISFCCMPPASSSILSESATEIGNVNTYRWFGYYKIMRISIKAHPSPSFFYLSQLNNCLLVLTECSGCGSVVTLLTKQLPNRIGINRAHQLSGGQHCLLWVQHRHIENKR